MLLVPLTSAAGQTAPFSWPQSFPPSAASAATKLCAENEGHGKGTRGWSEIGNVLRVVEADGETG